MAPQNSDSATLQAYIKRLWIHGFLAGFGVVLVILLILSFIWGWPLTSQEGPEEAPPAAYQVPATPAAPPAPSPKAENKTPGALEGQLSAVLGKLGEANQKKDLHQLLSLYSSAFPDLPHKAQEISRSWAAYDYLTLKFKLAEIKSSSPDTASARVTWEIKAKERQTGEIKDSTKTYLVQFTRAAGHWRIKSLKRVEKTAAQDEIS